MARAPSKAKAAEPVKINPVATVPTPADVNIRGRATRPTFRRGGLVFGDRDWTPIEPEAIGPDGSLAILIDPVITIQGRDKDGEWGPMPADLRAHLVEVLQNDLTEEKSGAA